MFVYCNAACCKNVPRKRDMPIKMRYLINNFFFKLISYFIFFLSKNNAIGKIVKKPTVNLAELNVNGPMLSIPVSCAIKAVPQINEQVIAHANEINFLFMLFIIVI